MIMLEDLDRTQAYIKKESVQDQNKTQTDPAPGTAKDQSQQSTNDSAPESKF
jgi:hypothetical protein